MLCEDGYAKVDTKYMVKIHYGKIKDIKIKWYNYLLSLWNL